MPGNKMLIFSFLMKTYSPLVLNLLIQPSSANNPCYILVPQCTESSPWSSFPQYPGVYTPDEPTRSTAQVLSLIDTLLHSDSIQIDPDRIYVTGYSLGGEGTFDIITRAPRPIALFCFTDNTVTEPE